MLEIELLTALAQANGGVQINISRNSVTVSTRYTPLIRGTGKTVFQAARECTKQLLAALKKHPTHRKYCPDVLKALDKYDKQSGYLCGYKLT